MAGFGSLSGQTWPQDLIKQAKPRRLNLMPFRDHFLLDQQNLNLKSSHKSYPVCRLGCCPASSVTVFGCSRITRARISGFRARFRQDSTRENIKTVGRPIPAGGRIFRRSRLESGRNAARKTDFRPGGLESGPPGPDFEGFRAEVEG